MLLLRRSFVQARDYPMLFKETGGVSFDKIKNCMEDTHFEFRTLKRNQGKFAQQDTKYQARGRTYAANEQKEDPDSHGWETEEPQDGGDQSEESIYGTWDYPIHA